MQKLIGNLNFMFIAILATGTILITQSAFKNSSKLDSNSYYFTGNSTSEMRDLTKWTASSGSGETCVGSDLPCLVVLQDGQTIANYLQDKSDTQIINGAKFRKQEN